LKCAWGVLCKHKNQPTGPVQLTGPSTKIHQNNTGKEKNLDCEISKVFEYTLKFTFLKKENKNRVLVNATPIAEVPIGFVDRVYGNISLVETSLFRRLITAYRSSELLDESLRQGFEYVHEYWR
jgi:hypothetical protein